MAMLTPSVVEQLQFYASQYETIDFLQGDPSSFMHRVQGETNQETTAFVAAALSYGSRTQFMPKIEQLLLAADGDLHRWILQGDYRQLIPDNGSSYYRLYSNNAMLGFFGVLRDLLAQYGSLGAFARDAALSASVSEQIGCTVLEAFSGYFWNRGVPLFVPRPHSSACKRPCMFLRWMVRDNSPVDLGLWSTFIPKTSLYIPLDTHVLQMARRLGVLHNKTASWAAVVKLTDAMRQVFPEDPARADFALFGYGVDPGLKQDHTLKELNLINKN